MAKWTQEQKALARVRRLFRQDAITAAYRAGWEGACNLHFRNGAVFPDAYAAFREAVGLTYRESGPTTDPIPATKQNPPAETLTSDSPLVQEVDE